jgi:glucokinase
MSSKAKRRYAGVDIGGTKLHCVIGDDEGRVIARARKKTKPGLGFEGVIARVCELVRDTSSEADVPLGKLAGLGCGAPSPILPDGTAVNAPNLGWKNVPIAAALKKELGLSVRVANDCDAGTYGEFAHGVARGKKSVVGLFMGTGLGGGLVIDGKVQSGGNGIAAEVGHMVVMVDGRRCGCGHRGCLEAYASKTGMARYLACQVHCEGRKTLLTELCEGDYSRLRSSVLQKAYEQNDEVAVEILNGAARYLGIGAGNLITLLAPDMVFLGGGVMEAMGETLLPLVQAGAKEVVFPAASFEHSKIVLGTLEDDAVALGALALALG